MIKGLYRNGAAAALLLICAGFLTDSRPIFAAQLSVCQGQYGPKRAPNYQYHLDTRGQLIPKAFASDIERTAGAIYRSWADLLAAKPPFAVDVQLQLMSDTKQFANLKSELAPELPSVTGFYAGRSNLAVALYHSKKPEGSRRTAIHEISHLITTSQIGSAPPWLAEGLAEYHEMIQFDDKGRPVVPVNERDKRLLGKVAGIDLQAFFNTPAEYWRNQDSQQYYAISWSLVFFLMDSPQGRGALGRVLQQATTHSCERYSAARFLHRAWPGGLPDLERQWRQWVQAGNYTEQLL